MSENETPQRNGFGVGAERDFFASTEETVPQKPMQFSASKNIDTIPGGADEALKISVPPKPAPKREVAENIAKTLENTPDGLMPLRTYRQDVAEVIRDKKTSLVRLVLEEQKERNKREQEISPTSKKNLPLIFLSVIFFFSTLGVIYYIYFKLNPVDHTLENLHVTPLIFVEKTKEIPADGTEPEKLSEEIINSLSDKDLKVDAIEYFFFTDTISRQTSNGVIREKNLISSSRFFEATGIKIPSMLLRSLRPDFMFGVHSFNKNQAFLILKTDYYDNAFAGMLDWEKTLSDDLLPIFGRAGLVRDLSQKKWDDTVIKNKDTRSLRNFDGSIALVYAFKDQRTLIITTSEDTLLEVSRRLDLAKEKRPE